MAKENKITITYTYDPSVSPNSCKAETTFQGETLKAYGASWTEAKSYLIGLCNQAKALGEVPKTEDVDLDAAA